MKPLQGNYVSSGRFQRDCDRDEALKSRDAARFALKWGWKHKHGYWMRRAMRYWRYYADAVRSERKAA